MSFDGEDLGPYVVEGTDPKLPALSIFDTKHDERRWSLRGSDWKLNQWKNDGLHHLSRDPGEQTNLTETKPERVRRLRERAEKLLDARAEPSDSDARPSEAMEDRLRSLGYLE